MATQIEQHPLHTTLPTGQDVIFSVSNTNIIANFTGVKMVAEVHISSGLPPNLSTSDDIVGTFKTTPNNAGVGMFDFRPIIESFVNADNLAREGSAYKLAVNTSDTNVPMHLIDKYSGNLNTMRYLAIVFTTEYIDSSGDLVIDSTSDNSDDYKVFNGYLKYTDILELVDNNFGYNLSQFIPFNNQNKFLSNAPLTQYANLEDYGTISFLALNDRLSYIKLNYVNNGISLGFEKILRKSSTGAYDVFDASISTQILYFGCFPANLQGSSAIFKALIIAGTIQGGAIEVTAFNSANNPISATYTINVNCPTLKGFEPIRLTWLNQWGAWDYYTFTMKSSKMISTKGSTYQQLEGSWNESFYRIDGFKGGKKSFRVNATEKITMNTDFVNESESEWFEDLINSPEVYILKGYKDEAQDVALNQYVIPVRLTTSSFTKKTIANDKVMQYTFEVEKSKTLRTQSI